jgi:hypothetical protein
MNTISIFIFIFFMGIIIYYTRKQQIENFNVTWTPYIIDKYNQPGYSNYFYHNNYMYPSY